MIKTCDKKKQEYLMVWYDMYPTSRMISMPSPRYFLKSFKQHHQPHYIKQCSLLNMFIYVVKHGNTWYASEFNIPLAVINTFLRKSL